MIVGEDLVLVVFEGLKFKVFVGFEFCVMLELGKFFKKIKI